MLVAQHPLHGSVGARASGRDDQTLVRVRVAYVRDGKPVRNQAEYATPAQMIPAYTRRAGTKQGSGEKCQRTRCSRMHP
jgi:hypothetical protein